MKDYQKFQWHSLFKTLVIMECLFYFKMCNYFCFLLPLCREADDGCKKQMERLLNIWKERSLYRADFIQQLKLAIEDSNSPRPPGQIVVNVKKKTTTAQIYT